MGPRVPSAGRGAALLLPGVLLAVTSFASGGFFPDATAAACIVVLAALVLRLVAGASLIPHARGGVVVAVGALALFAGWVLLSTSWSDATARGLLEYQRVLLYLATLVLFALLGRSTGGARLLLGGLAVGGLVACVAALGVWLAPDHFPVGADFPRQRLSWPTSYWNTTGLLGTLTALFCLGLTCDPEAPAPARALAAGGVPLAAAVLFFSVSRGAALALVVGVVAFVLLRPGRGLLTGGLVSGAAALAAVLVARSTDGLDTALPVPARAVAEGHRSAWILAAIATAAILVRALLLAADRGLAAAPPRTGRARAAVVAAAVVGVALFLVAFSGASRVQDIYDDFTAPASVSSTLDPTERFASAGNNGRLEHWRVALDLGFDPHPWHGSGAGTYALLWSRGRESAFSVVDGHSLYVETLGEFGLVGLALVVVTLLTLLLGLGRRAVRCGGPWTALAAAALGWTVHAGIDWLWEVPAVTLWLFAAGGFALGARSAATQRAAAVGDDDAAPQTPPPRRFPTTRCP